MNDGDIISILSFFSVMIIKDQFRVTSYQQYRPIASTQSATVALIL